jgi:hypothetical protein
MLPRARWSLSAERRSPPPPSTTGPPRPPGDQGRLAPARRGPRRQGDGPPGHLTPPTGENWRPPAWESGGRQPRDHQAAQPDLPMAVDTPPNPATAGPHARRILSRVGAADHAMTPDPAPTWGQRRPRRRLGLVYAQIRQRIRSGPPEGPFLGSRRSNRPLPVTPWPKERRQITRTSPLILRTHLRCFCSLAVWPHWPGRDDQAIPQHPVMRSRHAEGRSVRTSPAGND